MKRKAFAALAAVCLVLCLILAGCGTVSEEDYPPLEKVDLSSMTLGTVSNSTFSTQYPADKWTGSDGTSPLIIYYNDTQGTGQAVNINATVRHLQRQVHGKIHEQAHGKHYRIVPQH